MPLSLVINGQARAFGELGSGATLADVVEAMGLKPDRIAIEHNGEIASRLGWNEVGIEEGDRLEIVHFVGGGT